MSDRETIPAPVEQSLLAAHYPRDPSQGEFGACDLCGEVRIRKPAICERRIGQVHVSVCDAHRYRIDSAARARASHGR